MALLAVLVLSAFVRVYRLAELPPGLWYDEAIYALDALTIGHGNWPIFFTTEGHMREPLYIYSLAGFFALFGVSTLKARLAGAIWGVATVAVFYPVARRIVGPRWGIAATAAFAVFRWHVHFSRTVFRALTPPFFVLCTFWFFMRWRERKRPADAIACGAFMGGALYTYLSMRFLPAIMLCWMFWLLIRGELSLRRDWKGLGFIWCVAAITFAPLAVDYANHPEHFSGRTGEISMFEKTVQTPAGEQRVAKPFMEAARDLAGNALDVAVMWTIRGDHVAKHNNPYEPVFDWLSGLLFYVGLGWCLWRSPREQYAFLLIVWVGFMSLTSVFSFGAPNLLRMQAASPAGVLVYVLGLKTLRDWAARHVPPTRQLDLRLIAIALLVWFGAWQLWTYFGRFATSAAAHVEFLKETFYDPAESVAQIAPTVDRVLVPDEMAGHPTFRFVTHGVSNIRGYSPDCVDFETTGRRVALFVTVRANQLATPESRQALQVQLASPRAVAMRHFQAVVPHEQDARIASPKLFGVALKTAIEVTRVPWGELYVIAPE